tara:strand:- start:16645 stop:17622 length:978 start_codon:yes stop_codon:yes gene_type:complete
MKNWAEKYRPERLEDIVGQSDVHSRLFTHSQQGRENRLSTHWLFYSTEPGTGKTSTAIVLAKEAGWPIHIFNASSKKTRGIEFVEEQLLPMSRNGVREQVFLLDEADQLTPAAQSALKGVIENSQGTFILTCNDKSKISDYLLSRCETLTFQTISDEDAFTRLRHICGAEGVEITETNLHRICRNHSGDLRRSINALQAYHSIKLASGHEDADAWLNGLEGRDFHSEAYLTLCFKERDFEGAAEMVQQRPDSLRNTIRDIFTYAISSSASPDSKMRVVNAATTSERDLIAGVHEEIVGHNFVRMCVDRDTYNPVKIGENNRRGRI